MTEITIYTDGAAKGNPGRGGYGAVMLSGSHRKELSAGFRNTTNNRMELLSVIVALEKRFCQQKECRFMATFLKNLPRTRSTIPLGEGT